MTNRRIIHVKDKNYLPRIAMVKLYGYPNDVLCTENNKNFELWDK